MRRCAGSWRDSLRRWAWAAAATVLLGFGVFLLYFLAYPIRHLSLPMGFDPPYYVWRADYLASQGLGSGSLAARPGYPILSVLVGSLTGLSQLRLISVLSLVLVALLALAVGALVSAGMGAGRWRWALTVAVAGIVVGPTHLVGENLSNTLNLIFEVAALVPLAWAVARGRGFWAAVALLVAAGVAHWDFLATFAGVLLVAAVLALPASRRDVAAGTPALRTEAGLMASLWTVAAALVGLIIAVLRAPLVTIEVGQDRILYWKKFKRDLGRLFVPAGAALLVAPLLPVLAEADPPVEDRADTDTVRRRRAFASRILIAWTAVTAVGVVVGALTLRLPPARFLALLVAVPGAVAITASLVWMVRLVRGRVGRGDAALARAVAPLTVVVVLCGLAVPGLVRWYRYPVLLNDRTLREADVAGRYVGTLPPHVAVVVPVEYGLPPFPTGPILAERSLRIGLPPDRQRDVHVFVGTLEDLMAGRQTPPPNDRLDLSTRTYRRDVSQVIRQAPVVVVLEALSGPGSTDARRLGGAQVGPGVLVLRAPSPPARLVEGPAPQAVASVPGSLWGLAIIVLLGICGWGWTRVMLDRRASAHTLASMAPVVGAAVMVLGGLVADKAGVPLKGGGGVATYVVLTMAGLAAHRYDSRGEHGHGSDR